ncbi:hypothetical protein BTA51_04025 [Hahella sp. CCB-MM4]|uniref:hypothetical protein n=1 Tax=Hahella sp. (strain CCB-MM4) TaxID=1926491 RepID=UPI000B9ACBA6|nr:hypothetical protein [Hahella sp. CCB-MM4]OZG74194.1 hypothetical protein BTA51_04025 [Hahella sp. CCB-MM4]
MKNLLKSLVVFTFCTAVIPGVAMAKNNKSEEKSLPPGLEKQQSRGKALPPGWEKKLNKGAILDPVVYEQGEVVDRDESTGTVTIETADKTIQVIEKTREIIDILN